MQYVISFLEGIITFISPCLLPMLPIYISYFAGGGERSTKKTLSGALGFVSGFTVIFVLNALGSAFVFFFKKDASPKANTLFLGFAAGVMVAASFFSLLLPAFEGAGSWGVWSFIPVAVGFLLGGVFLVLLDKIVPHIHFGTNEEEGLHSSLKKPDEALFCCYHLILWTLLKSRD